MQRRFSEQHSVAMLEQCCNHSKQCRNNAVMLCCAKNRCCELCNITLKVMLRDDSQHKCDPYYICDLPCITFCDRFLHMAPIPHCVWDPYYIGNQFLITFCTNFYIWDLNRALVFFPLFDELFVMLISISTS